MIRISDFNCKATLKAALVASAFLLFAAVAAFGQQQINLIANPTTATMPDGTTVPMWGYFCGTAVAGSTATCASLAPNVGTPPAWAAMTMYSVGNLIVDSNGNVQKATASGMSGATAPASWSTVATVTTPDAGVTWTYVSSLATYLSTSGSWAPINITVPTGQGLTINLTNNLSFTPTGAATANTVPTSIVIVGQVGGGLGSQRTVTTSPSHTNAQGCPTWFIASGATPPGIPCTSQQAGASGIPPTQGPRVQSMATEVATGTTTSLTWAALKPGTYLLESGTHPSIQVPMGLIGVLVVTTAPSNAGTTAGVAYPATATSAAVPYNAELPLEFSEIDPVQNKEVDQAVRTAGFSETAVWTRMNTGSITALNLTSGGSGYTAPLSVSIAGSGGGAATATLGGFISNITLTAGGTGYTSPTVTISDTGTGIGTGATATATVAGGVITGIIITNPGSNYSAPMVTIGDTSATPGTGAMATATTTGTPGVVYSVTLTGEGGAYTSAPMVMITGGAGTGAMVTATVVVGGCGIANTCYPPAVNYTPLYYLINGVAFSKANASASVFPATAGVSGTPPVAVTTGITGTVLVRIVNAGLRMHTPSIVNSLTQGFSGAGTAATVAGFSLIAEDGNVLPNVAPLGVLPAPRVQTDVLMVPSKVYDALINVPATPTTCTPTPVPPATCPTPALPIFARDLALSGNSSVRDAGMVAYISVNNIATALGAALPGGGTGGAASIFAAAQANADTYSALVAGQPFTVSDPSKGVIANDVNVYGVTLLTAPSGGTITCGALAQSTPTPGMCANGTFTYTPTTNTTAATDTFMYCANNGYVPATSTAAASCSSAALTATVTLKASGLMGGPACSAVTFNSKMATYIKVPSPGGLPFCKDPNGLPLTVVTTPAPTAAGGTLVMDTNGGFGLTGGTGTTMFSYTVQNSQGRTTTQTVTVIFPAPSNLQVNVLDAQAYRNCNGDAGCIGGLQMSAFTDYRWIIEEDKTFWVDPNCTTNNSITTPGCPTPVAAGGTIPTFGTNFHTSNMDFVAQGCTGALSCEGGQTFLNPMTGTHVPAVCDLGNGACRPDTTGSGFTAVLPSQVALDPAKRYYISVLPGDAGSPFPLNASPAACNGVENLNPTNNTCGHTMSGAPIPPACNILGGPNACPTMASTTPPAFAPVNVLVLPTPLPTGRLSVIVFEDDFPLNGEQDGGGGNGTVAPIEPGLGGFNLVLWDTFGGLGDVTGQDTYDMFNQPLSNGLSGTIDPVTQLDACPISPNALTGPAGSGTAAGAAQAPVAGMTGMIVTCPKYESDMHTLSPLAGQAVIYNLMPDKFSVQAYPGADRIARGEEWLQTNTLDGQHPHDSFIRIGEPGYFQEYGPAGYHVAIGFANPAIINARANDVCNGAGTPGTVGPCTNTIDGQVDVQRISRTPDQRLYPSGSRDAFAWTQCWVSLGDPDGEDFMFTKCDANGNFKFTGVPGGNWRLTIGDQWNDQIIDGLSTPANVGCTPNGVPNGTTNATTCPGGQMLHLGNIGVQQWQANLYTRVFIDDNKNGIWDPGEIGIPFLYTRVYYRDGSNANGLNTDFNGVANFNETYPLFNWYVVEADSTRYKTTGIHTVYDAGGPADGSPSCGNGTTARQCGTSTAYNYFTNTFEGVPLPADLSVPGAVYCAAADCMTEAKTYFANGLSLPSSASASTGRIDPPWVTSEGWAGLTGLSNWITFGKAPYAACPPACVTPGAVGSISVTSGGTGYAVGNTISLTGGSGTGAVATVATISGTGTTGPIATVTLTNAGSGYTSAPTVDTTLTGTGTGAILAAALAPGFGENGGIHGQVTYASTRPFDDASQMILQPWEPLVPGVKINLYQEGFAADGVTPTLTLVDTTLSSNWDDWAQGFWDGATAGTGATLGSFPYMNCPGQGLAPNAASPTPNPDVFFFTLFDQPNFLDYYASIHSGAGTTAVHPLPYNSQYKCYDSMHIGNQIQPAPYNGEYYFPSSIGIDPKTGKPITPTGYINPITGAAPTITGTNCTICVSNPTTATKPAGTNPDLSGYDPYRAGTPMLPPGKYVVEVVMPPGYEVYKEEDKNLLIGDNFIAPVTQQFGGLGTDIFIIPDQASVASMYDESNAGYNPNNFQNQTTGLGLSDELSGVPGYPGFQDPVWPCVGEMRVVPDYLSLFPHAQEVAPFAGATRPLCDRKEVTLANQMNVRMHFAIYTSTHIASKFAGGITDDYTSEFDPFSPQFGEKFAPPNMPVSTKDYLGNEISRVYSDHWGTYDGLTFSSWEVNPPNITGYSPSLMVQCMNDPGQVKDTNPSSPTYGHMITDPLYNPAYSNFCYEIPFMPGLTTYNDTPVVPTQAFVGAAYNNADCSYPDTTPAIKEVDGTGVGPWVSAANATLTITALGDQLVQNSAYSGPSASVAPFNQKTITRHYGFGAQCLAPTPGSTTCNTLSQVTIGGAKAVVNSWSDTAITVAVPAGLPNCTIQQQAQYQTAGPNKLPAATVAQCGELVITAGNGKQSIDSVTVTVGGKPPTHILANQSIQAAIDGAMPGDLLMIDPTCMTVATTPTSATCSSAALNATTPTQTASVGSHNELLIMWKPVRLQGVGAASSVLNASAFPAGTLLDPWRRHINCLFGLTLSGVPYTSGTNPTQSTTNTAPYDSTGSYQCPDTGWQNFNATPGVPQIDRLPLEAVLGWDATQNGNLAEQLQEPSLMGAFEGAGITVLGKGVDYHAASPWTDGNEGGAFPTNTTLLTGVGPSPVALPTGDANIYCHTLNDTGAALASPETISSQTNPYPSNFMCNPSSIDGISVINSSQGGGGIFAHGWAHHLQIANNRVFNNAGTLTGGISVGQGEFPTPYIQGGTTNAAPGSCSDGTGFVANQHLPYCLQLEVNVHNNFISNNSSLGDELFGGTLAGSGGATFCTGNDYYLFDYNWVCGNLSSGEGGGVVHLGEIQNGDIEHNSIVLNQSTNPTIPTNGGGIMVQGTPDTDPICGTQIDTDCPPGLSDGIGHNLVINANLIQGNMAESGSGGGIRLQQVNGTDVSTFAGIYLITAADQGHTVRITTAGTLPAVGDSVTVAGVTVGGYNGTFIVNHVGIGFFTYLAPNTGLAIGASGTYTDTTAAGTPQTISSAVEVAPTTVTILSSASPAVGDQVVIAGVTPTGYVGTYTVTSVPAGSGSFTYTTTAGLSAGTGGTVVDSSQSSAQLWNSVFITNNMIVNNLAGWDGAGISLQDALNVSIINNTIASNDSLASSGVLTQSIGTPQASAPPGSCTATNGTTTTSCPQSAGVTSTQNTTLLTTTFTGLPGISCPQPNCTGFSNPLLQNNVIWQNRSFIIGVSNTGTPTGTGTLNQQNLVTLLPTIMQAASGQCGAGANYWDIGVRGDTGPGNHASGFSLNPTNSVLDDTGYASSNTGVSPSIVTQYCNGSRVPPECSVMDGCAGPGGYGVPPGIVDASTPNPLFSLTPSATVDEGNNWINVGWGPLALSNDALAGGLYGNYGGGSMFGNYALNAGSPAIDSILLSTTTLPTATVPNLSMDFYGNPRPDASNPTHFDVGAVEFQGAGQNGLLSINPNTGAPGTTVMVTITGTGLSGATAVNVSGGGIRGATAGSPVPFVVVSDTQINATFTITAGAALTARNVTVVVPGSTKGPITFTVVAGGPTPTLTSICVTNSNPCNSSESIGTSQSVTLTGTNFGAGATVNINTTGGGGAGGLIITNVVVVSPTTITATFSTLCGTVGNPSCSTITPGARQIDVVSAGQASNSLPFTISGPMLTSIMPASVTKNVTGTTTVTVTLTGTGLTGIGACGTPSTCAPGVFVSGGNVTVTGVTPSTTTPDTTVTATLTFTGGASTTARNVTATTPDGTTNAVTFTLLAPGAAPVLTSITPNSVTKNVTGTTTVNVTLTGTGLTGIGACGTPSTCAPGVTVSGGGVTVTGVTPSTTTPDTTVIATLTFSTAASTTARSVTAITPNGTSNPVTFTLIAATSTAPTLTSITPNSVAKNMTGVTSVNVTLTGTGLTGIGACGTPSTCAPGVTVSGGNVTVTGVTPSTTTPDTTVTATLTFSTAASTTARNVTATTPGGTSNPVTFTLLSAPGVLNSILPNSGVQGTTVTVTFNGCGIAGSTAVSFVGGGGGGGVTVGTPTTTHTGTGCPSDPDTVTATFTISAGAALTARNVRLASPTGNTNTLVFNVVSPGTPTLVSITPNSGLRATSVPVVLAGTGFTTTGTSANVATPSNGVSITAGTLGTTTAACGAGVPLPCITATVTITGAAAVGAREIFVTTPGGTTGTVPFTVTGPVLDSISPAQAVRGQRIPVSLFGSGLTGSTVINIAGGGGLSIVPGTLLVVSDMQVNATLQITPTAAAGARSISVTTPTGLTNTVPFTVIVLPAPTITSIAPTMGVRGSGQIATPLYPAIPVTLTGTDLTGADYGGAGTGLAVSGGGVTVSNLKVVDAQTATATFTITAGAAVGPRNVTITTGSSGTGTLTGGFTVLGPTLTAVTPSSGVRGTTGDVITLTGTNLDYATGVTVSGGGVTCTISGTPTSTSATATCTVAAGTIALTARNVSVVTAIGTTPPLAGAFTVTGAALTISAPTPTLAPTPANAAGTTNASTITVTNAATATGAFTFTAVPTLTETAGTANGTFSVTAGGTCIAGTVVAPGGSCTITLQYVVTNAAATATAHVTVAGTGLATATLNSAAFTGN